MSLLDQVYGEFPTMSGPRFYGQGGPDVGPGSGQAAVLDPAKTSAPSQATRSPSRPVVDEPGAGRSVGLNPAALMDNPVTWLVLTLGAALALIRYASVGRVL